MIVAAMLAVIAVFCAGVCWFAWDEGFVAGQMSERRNRLNVDNRKFIHALAQVMEVPADGGDSAEDYVQWAVLEAQRIAQGEQP